jgi:DNA-binding transcriptional LysR family regulator
LIARARAAAETFPCRARATKTRTSSQSSLTVTEAGPKFYAAATQLTDEFTAPETSLRGDGAEPSGLVRVTAAPVFGRLYVVPRLAQFFDMYPGLRVEVLVSDRNLNLVEEGDRSCDPSRRPHGLIAAARRLVTSPVVTVATPRTLKVTATCDPGRPPGPLLHRLLEPVGGPPVAFRVARRGQDPARNRRSVSNERHRAIACGAAGASRDRSRTCMADCTGTRFGCGAGDPARE